ncbi:hypothetical protein METBIDRAFT_120359 [Metschnikowia bicuspidata var. bicuspidata NRRL YB-4993]|uniref:Secreted protein n=1 Tax=Metschnikowia bicuspidata var. bicuspidata NRRL YB-4993 TaxID=869754 RepID=A0A1A0HJZ0_9ASCO|nr:hypothetical protein METBIDRAFT_120359 [Metschnikowia bicuspidata var. bicuspidata NRRL YB-4993]OBA24202.1 hypothetical protein METBIDRAFT_120359 [Metschnikowia bicuspidata var. bicuspidata NRRL YB-4993]
MNKSIYPRHSFLVVVYFCLHVSHFNAGFVSTVPGGPFVPHCAEKDSGGLAPYPLNPILRPHNSSAQLRDTCAQTVAGPYRSPWSRARVPAKGRRFFLTPLCSGLPGLVSRSPFADQFALLTDCEERGRNCRRTTLLGTCAHQKSPTAGPSSLRQFFCPLSGLDPGHFLYSDFIFGHLPSTLVFKKCRAHITHQ